jgi:hypothetical protein
LQYVIFLHVIRYTVFSSCFSLGLPTQYARRNTVFGLPTTYSILYVSHCAEPSDKAISYTYSRMIYFLPLTLTLSLRGEREMIQYPLWARRKFSKNWFFKLHLVACLRYYYFTLYGILSFLLVFLLDYILYTTYSILYVNSILFRCIYCCIILYWTRYAIHTTQYCIWTTYYLLDTVFFMLSI